MQCGKIKQGKEIEGVGSGCYFKEDSQNLLTAAVISGKEKTVRVSYEVEVFQTEESKSPEVDVHLGSLKSNRHKFVQKEAQRYEGRPEKKKGQI